MTQYVVSYITTAVIFLTVDLIWLGKVAKGFYASRLGDLLLEKPNLLAAAMFYAIYVLGILIFAIWPALKAGSGQYALLYGALFGFFSYTTYDMTNYATLRNWPLSLTLVDIAWGTLITGTSAFGGYFLTRVISGN